VPAGGVWLAMKGKHPADELAALPPGVEVFHVEPLQVPGLDAERCLVWMRQHTRPDAGAAAPGRGRHSKLGPNSGLSPCLVLRITAHLSSRSSFFC
jgi:hypothetical protein